LEGVVDCLEGKVEEERLILVVSPDYLSSLCPIELGGVVPFCTPVNLQVVPRRI